MSTKRIKWSGTAILMLTAALTAFNVYPLNLIVGSFANIMLNYVAFVERDKQYMLINLMFITLNFVGIWSYYG